MTPPMASAAVSGGGARCARRRAAVRVAHTALAAAPTSVEVLSGVPRFSLQFALCASTLHDTVLITRARYLSPRHRFASSPSPLAHPTGSSLLGKAVTETPVTVALVLVQSSSDRENVGSS